MCFCNAIYLFESTNFSALSRLNQCNKIDTIVWRTHTQTGGINVCFLLLNAHSAALRKPSIAQNVRFHAIFVSAFVLFAVYWMYDLCARTIFWHFTAFDAIYKIYLILISERKEEKRPQHKPQNEWNELRCTRQTNSIPASFTVASAWARVGCCSKFLSTCTARPGGSMQLKMLCRLAWGVSNTPNIRHHLCIVQ